MFNWLKRWFDKPYNSNIRADRPNDLYFTHADVKAERIRQNVEPTKNLRA